MAYTEKLIDLVRERQFLYDISDKDYKNRNKIKAAWLEIATEMGTQDDKHWMSKWKNLKDNYSKHKKSIAVSSGQAYKKYKNWPWAELMRFLDDPTETNIKCEFQSPPGNTQESLNSSTEEIQESSTQVSVESRRRPGIRKRKAEPPNQALEYLCMKNEQKPKLDEVDYLFLSYAQAFKKLPNRMQSMMKLEIATLFARYELQNEAGASGSSGTFQMVPPSLSGRMDFDAFRNSIFDPLSEIKPINQIQD